MTRLSCLWLVALSAVWPVQALAQQQQRIVVVPADAAVVIAARGQRQPRAAMAPPPSQAALARSRARTAPADQPDEIMGAAAIALVPMIAAGVLAATLGGGEGQASPATVRTR